jgi:hypothetical protein
MKINPITTGFRTVQQPKVQMQPDPQQQVKPQLDKGGILGPRYISRGPLAVKRFTVNDSNLHKILVDKKLNRI